MVRPIILSVDDQDEIREGLLRDLESFESYFDLYDCESAADARLVLDEAEDHGVPVALIISDHVMPEETGVQFLTRLLEENRFLDTKKLLLTGLATHSDTIKAINEAKIDNYVAKPWDHLGLQTIVSTLITHFIFDTDLDYRQFGDLIDMRVVLDRSR
jgi:two-component system, chemotaxis family, chemotaxis protein CheY